VSADRVLAEMTGHPDLDSVIVNHRLTEDELALLRAARPGSKMSMNAVAQRIVQQRPGNTITIRYGKPE